jgi:MFS family permease
LRTVGGFFAGILGFLGIAAAGWYIAISAVAVIGGAVLGLLFGVMLLPKFAAVRTGSHMQWWRWVAVICVTLCLAIGIVYPLLPDRDAQSLEVRVVRFVPGSEKISVENTGLLQTEVIVLNSLGLTGKLLGGIQSFSGGGEKQARALIVVSGAISSKVTLREPKATSVVYVQDGNRWNMYPSDAPTLPKTITLIDGLGEYEGLSIAIKPIAKPVTFTWYPPIKREQH